MSKNLSDEYRKSIQDDLPDLWERIESSLPEKNVTAASEAANTFNNTQSTAGKIRRTQIYRFAAIAAACICAAIIIPTALMLNSSSSHNTAATEALAVSQVNDTSDAVFEASAQNEETAEQDASAAASVVLNSISFTVTDTTETSDGKTAFECTLQEDYPDYGLTKDSVITVVFPENTIPSEESLNDPTHVFCCDLEMKPEDDDTVIYSVTSVHSETSS